MRPLTTGLWWRPWKAFYVDFFPFLFGWKSRRKIYQKGRRLKFKKIYLFGEVPFSINPDNLHGYPKGYHLTFALARTHYEWLHSFVCSTHTHPKKSWLIHQFCIDLKTGLIIFISSAVLRYILQGLSLNPYCQVSVLTPRVLCLSFVKFANLTLVIDYYGARRNSLVGNTFVYTFLVPLMLTSFRALW